MTTKIELGGERLSQFLARNEIKHDGGARFLIGEFADQAGTYDSSFGKIGLDFSLARENREIVLFCNETTLLRGKGEYRIRRLNVNNAGVGKQFLRKGVEVHFSTKATYSQFAANRR